MEDSAEVAAGESLLLKSAAEDAPWSCDWVLPGESKPAGSVLEGACTVQVVVQLVTTEPEKDLKASDASIVVLSVLWSS